MEGMKAILTQSLNIYVKSFLFYVIDEMVGYLKPKLGQKLSTCLKQAILVFPLAACLRQVGLYVHIPIECQDLRQNH